MQKLSIATKLAALPLYGLVLATAAGARAQITPPPAPPGASVARLTYASSGVDPATVPAGIIAPLPPAAFASGQASGFVRDSSGKAVAGVFITSSFSSYYTVSDYRGEYILDLNLIAGLGAWLPARLDGQLLDLTFTTGSSQAVTHPRLDVLLPQPGAPIGTGNVTQNATMRANGTLEVPAVAVKPTAEGFAFTRTGDLSAPLAVGVRIEGAAVVSATPPAVIRFGAGRKKETVSVSALAGSARGAEATATLLPAAFDYDPAKNTGAAVYQPAVGKDQAAITIP